MKKLLTSLNDVEVVREKGSMNDLLGYGALSQVRKVRHKANGKFYALKEMDLKAIHPNDIKNISREIKTHQQLDHPNVVHLYDNLNSSNGVLYLLLEYCDNNNLFFAIQQSKLDERTIHKWFYQTVQAIEYIHQRKIMHRDLKPENILLDKNFNVKVCDFGWCAEYNENERRQTLCGTSEYMAPEILAQRPQDFAIDIWALGILLYEMYHKKAPFTGKNPKDIENNIQRRKIAYTASSMSPEAKDLVEKMLQLNPKNRISIQAMYSHPFFFKFPFFKLESMDPKLIAAKGARRSYVGGEEKASAGTTPKLRTGSPPRYTGQIMTPLTQPSNMAQIQPLKIASPQFAGSNNQPSRVVGANQSVVISSQGNHQTITSNSAYNLPLSQSSIGISSNQQLGQNKDATPSIKIASYTTKNNSVNVTENFENKPQTTYSAAPTLNSLAQSQIGGVSTYTPTTITSRPTQVTTTYDVGRIGRDSSLPGATCKLLLTVDNAPTFGATTSFSSGQSTYQPFQTTTQPFQTTTQTFTQNINDGYKPMDLNSSQIGNFNRIERPSVEPFSNGNYNYDHYKPISSTAPTFNHQIGGQVQTTQQGWGNQSSAPLNSYQPAPQSQYTPNSPSQGFGVQVTATSYGNVQPRSKQPISLDDNFPQGINSTPSTTYFGPSYSNGPSFPSAPAYSNAPSYMQPNPSISVYNQPAPAFGPPPSFNPPGFSYAAPFYGHRY